MKTRKVSQGLRAVAFLTTAGMQAAALTPADGSVPIDPAVLQAGNQQPDPENPTDAQEVGTEEGESSEVKPVTEEPKPEEVPLPAEDTDEAPKS